MVWSGKLAVLTRQCNNKYTNILINGWLLRSLIRPRCLPAFWYFFLLGGARWIFRWMSHGMLWHQFSICFNKEPRHWQKFLGKNVAQLYYLRRFDDGYDDHFQSPNRSLRLDSLSEKFKGSNFSFILGS